MPNTGSPGKQPRLQSFFQPKQVTNQQQQQLQASGEQRQLQLPNAQPQQPQVVPGQQQQPHLLHRRQHHMHSGSKDMQGAATLPMQSVSAQSNIIAQQSEAHINKQQQQHSMMMYSHQPAAAKVSGVFADDDDFDDSWMSNHVLQAPAVALKTPAWSAQQQQSIMAMPVIDLSGSPARKKAKP